MRRLIETAVCVCVALSIVGTWLVEPYTVVSGSMHPTLLGPHRAFDCPTCGRRVALPADVAPMEGRPAYCRFCRSPGPVEDRLAVIAGDGVLCDRTAFWRHAPRRGQIIAFRFPGEASKIAVKRIVGLPGETIGLVKGRFVIDGRPLETAPFDRDYSPPYWYRGPTQWQLSADEYFVAGDNPQLSDDSRTWSAGAGVAAQLFVGQPVIVHTPRRFIEFLGFRFHVPDLSAIRYIR
jgi:signal peptidase I